LPSVGVASGCVGREGAHGVRAKHERSEWKARVQRARKEGLFKNQECILKKSTSFFLKTNFFFLKKQLLSF
jgi:hypothetical protein